MSAKKWWAALCLVSASSFAQAQPALYGVTTGQSFETAKKELAFCNGCRVEFNERPTTVSHYTVYLNYLKERYSNTPNSGVNFNGPWEAVYVTIGKQGQVVSVLNQIHGDEAKVDGFIAQRAKESGLNLVSINERLEGLPATTLISDGRSKTSTLDDKDATGQQFRISKVKARSGFYLVSASYTDFDLYHRLLGSTPPQAVQERDVGYTLAKLSKMQPLKMAFGQEAQSTAGKLTVNGSAVSLNGRAVYQDEYDISGIAKLPGADEKFMLAIESGGNSCSGSMSKILTIIAGQALVSDEFGFCAPPAVYDAKEFDSSFVMVFESDNPEYTDDKQVFLMR